MAIQQSDSRVGSTEPFPANENSTFPSKSTVNGIIYSTIVIALFGILLGLANAHPHNQADFSAQPQIREQAPKPGSHDQ